MERRNKGFTLIELMIVIAIVGILASIAISSHQDYLAKSQVSEAISLMNGLKGPLAEYHATSTDCPTNGSSGGTPEGTSQSNLFPKDTDISGRYVKRVKVGFSVGSEKCAIWAEMRGSGVNKNIAGKLISLRMSVTSGSYTYECYVNFPEKYAPNVCTYRGSLSIN